MSYPEHAQTGEYIGRPADAENPVHEPEQYTEAPYADESATGGAGLTPDVEPDVEPDGAADDDTDPDEFTRGADDE